LKKVYRADTREMECSHPIHWGYFSAFPQVLSHSSFIADPHPTGLSPIYKRSGP